MQLDVEFQATDLDQSRKHTRWVGRPGYPELLQTRLVKRTVCKYQEFPHLVYYRKSGVVAWRERKKEPGAENYLRMIPHKSVFQNSQQRSIPAPLRFRGAKGASNGTLTQIDIRLTRSRLALGL